LVDGYEDWISPSCPKSKTVLPSDTTRSEQLHANRNSVAGCFDTTPPSVRGVLSFSGSPIRPGPFSGRSSLLEATNWPLLALRVLRKPVLCGTSVCVRLVSEDGGRVSFWACESLRNLGGEIQDTFSNNTPGFYTLCPATGTSSRHAFSILDTALQPTR
jgi:hypothetical protein